MLSSDSDDEVPLRQRLATARVNTVQMRLPQVLARLYRVLIYRCVARCTSP